MIVPLTTLSQDEQNMLNSFCRSIPAGGSMVLGASVQPTPATSPQPSPPVKAIPRPANLAAKEERLKRSALNLGKNLARFARGIKFAS